MEKVNLNKADAKELQKIVHVGPKRAEKIIDYRKANKFGDVYELSDVTGFGKKRLDDVINQDVATV